MTSSSRSISRFTLLLIESLLIEAAFVDISSLEIEELSSPPLIVPETDDLFDGESVERIQLLGILTIHRL